MFKRRPGSIDELAPHAFSTIRLKINRFLGIFTHANTADRTYTLPDATTTLVGTDATQTLTNKSIAASEVNSGQLALAQGGTHADLSATGPGLIHQNSNGGDLAVLKSDLFCQGRLTLTTVTPVTTSDVMAATTVYFTPYLGDLLALYDGSNGWKTYNFTEISVAVPSTLFKLFDVFVYDNSGTPTLETLDWNQSTGSITTPGISNATPMVVTSTGHGLSNGDLVGISGAVGNTAANGKIWTVSAVTANTFALTGGTGNGAWTSGGTWYKIPNTRATSLVLQNGVLVKSGATTRRYLGTLMTTGTSGQTEDSLLNRLCWNLYNQVLRGLYKADSTTHTYNNTAERPWNADPSIRLQFVQGQARVVWGGITGTVKTATGGSNAYIGFSKDNETGLDLIFGYALNYNTQYIVASSSGIEQLGEGFHYLAAIEAGDTNAASFTQVQFKAGVMG